MDQNSPTEKDMDEALDATGFGKFHIWIILCAGLMMYTSNSESWSISYTLTSAECEMNLNLHEKTILVTVGMAGMMSTQFFWGYLADKIGRRSVLVSTLFMTFLCTVISVLMSSFWMLVMFRFLNGAFVAAPSCLSFTYISEFFSSRHRSMALLLSAVFIGFGLMVFPLLAWLIIPMEISLNIFGVGVTSWRVYIFVSGLSGLLASLVMYLSPESPKFLVQQQRHDEALIVLKQMHKLNNNKSEFSVGKISGVEVGRETKIWKLFGPKYIWKTALVSTLQIGIFSTSCGLFLWYPDILQRMAMEETDDNITICQALNINVQNLNETRNTGNVCDHFVLDSSIYLQNIFLGAAYTIGYILISILVSKVGIRNILMSFLGISGLATIALHIVTEQHLINTLFILLLALSGISIVVVNAAVVDLFPTHLRGMAVSIAMLAGRISSTATGSLFGYLLIWNCDFTFIIFGLILLGCALLSIVLSFCSPKKHDGSTVE